METGTNKKVYVLQLVGSPYSAGGVHILEIGGISHEKKTLETLMVKKNEELDEYFGDDDGEDGWNYHNCDFGERPAWYIEEMTLL